MKASLFTIVILLFLVIACTKSGSTPPVETPPADTAVATPPKDTATTTPPKDTTGTAIPPSGMDTITMVVSDATIIAKDDLSLVATDFSDNYTDYIGTATDFGSNVISALVDPKNVTPISMWNADAGQDVTYSDITTRSYKDVAPISDIKNFVHVEIKTADTVYEVFPVGKFVLRNFTTLATKDDMKKILGVKTALDGHTPIYGPQPK